MKGPLAAFAFACASILGRDLFAADVVAEPVERISETAVSAGVRAALRPEGLRVRQAGTVLADLWLVAEVVARKEAQPKPGVSFAGIPDGSLLGAIRFEERWSDYRGHPIPAGTYTLRYAVQPNDGDHMGVSEFLDFAVLVPALRDVDPKPISDRKALYALSAEASGGNHPAILSLVPPDKSVAENVTFVASPGGRAMGFVLRGRADAGGG